MFVSGRWFAVCALFFCTCPHIVFCSYLYLLSLFFSVHTYVSLCAKSLEFVFLFSLKLASAIYEIFNFSANDSPSKIMKSAFYFIEKALFILEIFEFLYFHLPLFFSQSAIALVDD